MRSGQQWWSSGKPLSADRAGETFQGTDGDDQFTGTNGDDTFIMWLGFFDAADGAGGYDTLIVDHSSGDPRYGGGGEIRGEADGSFSGYIGSGGSQTRFSRMESIAFTGSATNDEIHLDATLLAQGNSVDLSGGGGINRLFVDYHNVPDVHFEVGSDGVISSTYGKFDSFQQFTIGLGSGANYVRVGALNDTVSGGTGSNHIWTDAGDDTIVSYGIDRVRAGAGRDSWSFIGSTHAPGLTFQLGEFSATASDGTVAAQVEDVTINGTAGDETFNLQGRGTYRLSAGDGFDTLSIDDSATRIVNASYYFNVSYDGTLYGSATGNIGKSFRYDTYDGMESVHLISSAADDRVTLEIAPSQYQRDYSVDGGSGHDLLILDLNEYDRPFSFIVARTGEIAATKGSFADFEAFLVAGGLKSVHAQLGDSDDRIEGSVVNDHLSGRGGDDQINGNGGNDAVQGGAGRDSLTGGAGNDALEGNGGDDFLVGGVGRDVLSGGSGADIFVFTNGESGGVNGPADLISDFNPARSDKIDLSLFDADSTAAFRQAPIFIGSSAPTGQAGEMWYTVANGNAFVHIDTDGDKISDFDIRLQATSQITQRDFIL